MDPLTPFETRLLAALILILALLAMAPLFLLALADLH